ncbi:hypothetical protein ATANTOWER_012283 [Ataeniobius toweri]|uniref:Uncharacterized protein n=1 Tax=Ataeniobius toweri TaxID=208326 RepID=A0ABU7AB02_9TELE|nr:hypothetical protein [Ataeniobius toweri]
MTEGGKKTQGNGRMLTRLSFVLFSFISSPDLPTAPEEDKEWAKGDMKRTRKTMPFLHDRSSRMTENRPLLEILVLRYCSAEQMPDSIHKNSKSPECQFIKYARLLKANLLGSVVSTSTYKTALHVEKTHL